MELLFFDLLFFTVSFLASVLGGICGIGGGVVIKPVLDATGLLSVSAVSFLSGCTVLCMSAVNCFRNRKVKGLLELNTATPLAVGAVIGGILGKALFDSLKAQFGNESLLGAVQSLILLAITIGALLYSVFSARITTHRVHSFAACCAIGVFLGMMSSFLGIGGGPINLTVLYFFFSMNTKKAAANSLYIILFSQAASFLQTVLLGRLPQVSVLVLALMVGAGILGGLAGSSINKRIPAKTVDKLFMGFMGLIICICIFNAVRFLSV